MNGSTFAELDAVLTKVGAALDARQVHALYLGALTTTSFGVGPQKLLDGILGAAPKIANQEEANAVLPVVLGYWNTLLAQRTARGGAVELSPKKLGPRPTRTALETFAKLRENELEWYARGLGAGEPSDLGERGKRLIQSLAEGQMIFKTNALVLGGKDTADGKELDKLRGSLLELQTMMEQTMSELFRLSDDLRNDVVAPAPSPVTPAAKVGRNDVCTCGSGKKFKKCHGR